MRRPNILIFLAAILIVTLLAAPSSLKVVQSTSDAETTGYLILNEISPWPPDGKVWVELFNPTDNPVPLKDWLTATRTANRISRPLKSK